MEEIYRDIPGYEGMYQCSNLGNVKALRREFVGGNDVHQFTKEKILKQYSNKDGYLSVKLQVNGKIKMYRVHRLVAITFPEICGELKEGMQVNHKDCNPSNNVASNLEVCNCEYNNNYLNRNEKVSEGLIKYYDNKGRMMTKMRIREREYYQKNRKRILEQKKKRRAMKKSQPL